MEPGIWPDGAILSAVSLHFWMVPSWLQLAGWSSVYQSLNLSSLESSLLHQNSGVGKLVERKNSTAVAWHRAQHCAARTCLVLVGGRDHLPRHLRSSKDAGAGYSTSSLRCSSLGAP